MADPTRLTIVVQHADGTTTRWAPDEPSSDNVPTGITFSSTLPGGFSTAQFNLPRSITREYTDESLFDSVQILGAGNQVAWEGRIARLPREHSDRPNLSVGCIGHSARLRDDASFREIYVDHDKAAWGAMSQARRAAINTVASPVDPTTSLTSLVTGFAQPWQSTAYPTSEAWYNASGLALGSLFYAWEKGANVAFSGTDANFAWLTILSTDSALASTDATADLQPAAGTTGSGTLTATTSTRAYAMVQHRYNNVTLTAAPGTTYDIYWTCLAVYGNHGLTKRGTATATIGQGFYASDIIADVLTRQCPDLKQQIEATSYSIPQAAYIEPVTAEDVLLEINRFHNYRWGVFDNKTFKYWSVNESAATTWEARLADGARLALEGQDTTELYNSVVVKYVDVDGVVRAVGPTWATNVDYTDADLEITGDVATAHGIRRCYVLQLSGQIPNSDADGSRPAVQIGKLWLAEQSLPQRRGSITLSGQVKHPTEGMVPVWRIRAGDFILVSDRPGDVAREITAADYDHESRTVTLAVGGLPFKVEAMLDMLNTQMTATGF